VKDRLTLVYVRDISAHHEEHLPACSHRQAKSTKGLQFLTFFFSHFCLIVFFVIFISFAVDTSPQETQNSLNIKGEG
jgi:hypothetical protein